MKLSRSNFGWLFACIGLVLLLALSVYLGVSGFFYRTGGSYTTDLVLGQTVEAGLNKNEASSLSLNFSGGFLPDERLNQVISVKNAEESANLYLRAKVFVYTSQNQVEEVDVVENSNWTKIDDGYFYYNNLVLPLEQINFCSHVIVGSEDFQPVSWRKYILTVVFETLDESADVLSLWGVNPAQNV